MSKVTSQITPEDTVTTATRFLTNNTSAIDQVVEILDAVSAGAAALVKAFPQILAEDQRVPEERHLKGARRQDNGWEEVAADQANANERLDYVKYMLIPGAATNIIKSLGVFNEPERLSTLSIDSRRNYTRVLDAAAGVIQYLEATPA